MVKEKTHQITALKAKEILDSRGNPTVEAEVWVGSKKFSASVPSGASTGKYEAWELRDGQESYQGKGVQKAIRNVNEIIAPKLVGKDPREQGEIDRIMIELDGTKNKSKLGANAILAVSLAVCRAGAGVKEIALWEHLNQLAGTGRPSLPKPCFVFISGGAHANNKLDFQEFLLVPQTSTFREALSMGISVFQELRREIKKQYPGIQITNGDEGGFGLPILKPEEALDILLKATKTARVQKKIKIIIDVAASEFFSDGLYQLNFRTFDPEGLLKYYSSLVKKYPILGLEDPFSQDDWSGWQALKKQSSKILLIGDDLLVTNSERIKLAKEKDACSAAVIKPNQIGTVSETIKTVKLLKSYGWKTIVSHRAGETMDSFIADLAVGIAADFIKSGAPLPKERMAKYNRLLVIEKLWQN